MAAVAILQPSGSEVEHTDECGDEHHLVIVLGEGVVESHGYLGRRAVLLSHNSEHTSGRGHEETGGNTLSTDIAYAEIQLVVQQEVVIQVASDLPCRGHRCIEVQLLPFRERREHIRDHSHLDIVGNAKLALDTLLVSRSHFQLIDIGNQRGLHMGEGTRQRTDLVEALDLRQRPVEVSFGDVAGLDRQLFQRSHSPVDDLEIREKEQKQSQENQQGGDETEPVECTEDILFQTDQGKAPAGILQRLVERIRDVTAGHHLLKALLKILHIVSDLLQGRIASLQVAREDSLVEKLLRIGMYEERSSPADKDTGGMRIRFDGRKLLGEPLRGEVHRYHTYEISFSIGQGLAV